MNMGFKVKSRNFRIASLTVGGAWQSMRRGSSAMPALPQSASYARLQSSAFKRLKMKEGLECFPVPKITIATV